VDVFESILEVNLDAFASIWWVLIGVACDFCREISLANIPTNQPITIFRYVIDALGARFTNHASGGTPVRKDPTPHRGQKGSYLCNAKCRYSRDLLQLNDIFARIWSGKFTILRTQ
jgi:hypothetical protein